MTNLSCFFQTLLTQIGAYVLRLAHTITMKIIIAYMKKLTRIFIILNEDALMLMKLLYMDFIVFQQIQEEK